MEAYQRNYLEGLGIDLEKVNTLKEGYLIYSILGHNTAINIIYHTYVVFYVEDNEVDYFERVSREDYPGEALKWLHLHEYYNRLSENGKEQLQKDITPTELSQPVMLDVIIQTEEEYQNSGWFWETLL